MGHHEFRGMISHHGGYFGLALILKKQELSIENGEPLFSVDYKDPYIDDNYFDESEDESNGDNEFDDDA
jgi:hypothetical protein